MLFLEERGRKPPQSPQAKQEKLPPRNPTDNTGRAAPRIVCNCCFFSLLCFFLLLLQGKSKRQQKQKKERKN